MERCCEDLKRGMVSIKFEENIEMHNICNMKDTFVMIESRAFFEASKHILLSLQAAETETMPFIRYIIRAECTTVKPPLYLNESTCTYNMSCIYGSRTASTSTLKADLNTSKFEIGGCEKEASMFGASVHTKATPDGTPTDTSETDSLHPGEGNLGMHMAKIPADSTSTFKTDISDSEEGICTSDTSTDGVLTPHAQTGQTFNILDPLQWPNEDDVELDQSQIDALKLALTQEIAVIQGPPGTGKTYVGLKVVEVLLNNKHQWDPDGHSPILVVCFTNHALDQFLEGILSIKLKRKGTLQPMIARIGGRCKSEKISPFNVEQLCFSNELLKRKKRLRTQQSKLQDEMNNIQHHLTPSKGSLLTLAQLAKVVNNPDHMYQLQQVSRNKSERGRELEIWLDLQEERADLSSHNTKNSRSANNLHSQTLAPPESSGNDENKGSDRSAELVYVQSEADIEESQRFLTGDSDFMDDSKVQKKFNSETATENGIKFDYLYSNESKNFVSIEAPMGMNTEYASNLLTMPIEMRRKLYNSWVLKHHKSKILNKQEGLENFSSMCEKYKAQRTMSHCSILERRDVIGMTTTGAAKYQQILHQIKPQIVIVEEAAEVLEAHIISPLSAGTQHLILIGDHKQLRPKLNEYDLVKQYNFDVSLFERLINNGLAHATLNIQHRMRPEIANLIRPHIYETLHDHPSVTNYSSVKGVANNMFFITHEYPEEHNADTMSFTNSHEAQFITAFCKYLLQQGYHPTKITILTPYAGQILKLKNFMPQDIFSGIRVTTVDNFQGEENDIILLSLVRSNAEKNPGFVRELNRVCVALSRAKQGLYCIGNLKMLQQRVKLWNDILTDIHSKGHIGEGIQLYCQSHSDKVFIATLPKDFAENAPEGGCTQECGYNLFCGHSCQRKCHIDDREHSNYKCMMPCKRECPNGHPCQKDCFEECGKCEVIIEKQMPLCSHRKELPCHVDESSVPCEAPCLKQCKLNHPCKLPCYKPCRCDIPVRKLIPNCAHEQDVPCHLEPVEFKCPVEVIKMVPWCKHQQRMLCSEDPSAFRCEGSCTTPMPCGHKCPMKCKETCPKICREIVEEIQLECGHDYKVECHEKQSNSKILCLQKCTRILACGHPCDEKCYIPCPTVQCMKVAAKTLPCGHRLERECYKFQEPKMYPCDKDCPRKLPCGHQCQHKCGEDCDPAGCNWTCPTTMLCGHVCVGICGECYATRMHPMCCFDVKLVPFCGHETFTACSGLQHKCKKQKYTYSCPHNNQEVQCSELPPWCREPCAWSCLHHKCRKLCYEQCDRGPCNKQCMRPLRCGHLCASLCGEPCLDACPLCQDLAFRRYLRGVEDKRRLPSKQLYIQLKPCGHIFPVQYLDQYMKRKLDVICPRQCPDPRCRVNICCGFRYGNAAKAALLDCAKACVEVNNIESDAESMERSVIRRLGAGEYPKMWEQTGLKSEYERVKHYTKDMYQFAHLLLSGSDLITYLSHVDETFRQEFSAVCSHFVNICKTPQEKRILLSQQLRQDFTSEVFRFILVAMLHESKKSRSSSMDLRNELSIKHVESYLKTLDHDHFQRVSYQDFIQHQRSMASTCEVGPTNVIRQMRKIFLSTRCQWMKCDQDHYYGCSPMVKGLGCPECSMEG